VRYRESISSTWTSWSYRIPVSVDCTGGGGTIDVQFTVPKDLEIFWDNIQADADDVRVCDADGKTLLTYQLSSFTLSTRTCIVQVDGYAAPAAEMIQIWLYWGCSTAATGAGSFVAAGAKSGYVMSNAPPPITTRLQREPFRGQRPSQALQKATGEAFWVYVAYRHLLVQRYPGQAYGGGTESEEVDYVKVDPTLGGAGAGTLTDETKIRFYPDGAAIWLTAGSDATAYTIPITIVTVDGSTFISYLWLQVQNPDEA
jgi:hypothetical protein